MVRRNVIGFGTEDATTDFYANCYVITGGGEVLSPDRIRNLGDGRWISLWRQLDDSVGVFLVVCLDDTAQWLPLRKPIPCESIRMRRTLDSIIHGLTMSVAAGTLEVAARDGAARHP